MAATTTATLFANAQFVNALADALDYTADSVVNTTSGRREQLLREFQAKAPSVAAKWGLGAKPQTSPAKPKAQQPVPQADTRKVPQPGTVTEPVQGPNGQPQVFVHQATAAGVIYAPANGVQALAWAFATLSTKAELDALLGLAETLAVQTEDRLNAQSAAPAPESKPAPALEKVAAKNAPADTVKHAPQGKPTCKGTKADGTPCTSTICKPNGYCNAHQKQANATAKPKADKPAETAGKQTPAPNVSKTAPAVATVPTLFVRDGNGYRPATEQEVWRALELLSKAAA